MTCRPRILASTALGLLIASAPFGAFPLLSSAAFGAAQSATSKQLFLIKLKCKEGESSEACALRNQAPSENAAPLPATEPQPALEPEVQQPTEAAPASEAAPVPEPAPRLNRQRKNSLLHRPSLRPRRRPSLRLRPPTRRRQPPTTRLQSSKFSRPQIRRLWRPRPLRRLLRPISLLLPRANSRRKPQTNPKRNLPPNSLHHSSP